jgi:hypothetical protein
MRKRHSLLRTFHRKSRIEPLEARQMLAGDVLVAVSGGNLIVSGDDLDNQVAIHSAAEPGQYLVVGLNGTHVSLADGDGTPPSDRGGEAAVAPENGVIVNGVHRGARIRMGDGDDLVAVNNAHFHSDVSINTGAGGDTVIVGTLPPNSDGHPVLEGDTGEGTSEDPSTQPDVRVGIRGSLHIRTGADGDTVRVDNANIGRNLALATGEGEDHVGLGHRPASNPDEPGAGIPGAVGKEGEDPNATLHVRGRVRVALGAGNDELGMNHVHARAIAATGGVGDDHIAANGTASRSLFISGGRGEGIDTVNVHNGDAQMAAIRTGGGDDKVAITDSTFGLLAAGLGDGNDALVLGGTWARLALLSGGPGEEDLFRILGENMIAHQRIRGFELPPVQNDDNGDQVA